MKTKLTLIILILLFLLGCGSKKTTTQSQLKDKTDAELTDNSFIQFKIEQEQQLIDTKIKERIITLYGLRIDTIYQDGEPYPIYTSYPLQKEEERDINVENYLWRLNVQDSIQNAVELKYRSQIDEKDKNISDYKQSTMIYQIALLIISIIGIVLLVLYIKVRSKL